METFIQPVLYILNKSGKALDPHKIAKILYFADKLHLKKYARTITEDTYIKMNYGPVPSTIYDIIKSVLGKSTKYSTEFVSQYFIKVPGDKMKAVIDYDPSEFSVSEIHCLDDSIARYIDTDFATLSIESHDEAWMTSRLNREIDPIKIAKAGGADRSLIEYYISLQKLKTATFS